MQINLQHSSVATDNLLNLIKQQHTDIVLIKNHTSKQNSSNYKDSSTYIFTEDAVPINQLCDRDKIVLELKCKTRIFVASIYLT